MWETNPTKEYSPFPSSKAASPPPAAAPPPPGAPPPPLRAATAPSKSSACEKSQSAARSVLFPHALSAAFTCSAAKPMSESMATPEGSATKSPSAAGAGAPTGSFTSGSSECSKYHAVAASAFAFCTARAARFAAFSPMPIDSSCTTIISSGCGASRAGAAEAVDPPASSGNSASPSRRPLPRRCSRLSLSGIGTRQSSLLGTHFSSR
mmetsp:Transcript_64617/g.185813  ORF Transcript_64617/g.185813 Transcript_64617/m.185813 type:complete len:208 (+) Transcript_64617:371-994(+)